MALKWAVFDWGDTLSYFDYERVTAQEVKAGLYEKFGVRASPQEIQEKGREVGEEMHTTYRGDATKWKDGWFVRQLFGKFGVRLNKKQLKEIDAIRLAIRLKEARLLPHAREVLDFIRKKGLGIALVSNANSKRLNAYLDHFKVREYFSFILISEELAADKCSVKPFKILLKKINAGKKGKHRVRAEEMLMVGDRRDEDAYAKNLGMKTVLMNAFPKKQREWDEKPDFFVTDLIELKPIINNLLRE
jgi:putative hydrolase of the HAD superfamily